MSYSVTAYRVKWEHVEKYVFGSNNNYIFSWVNNYGGPLGDWKKVLADLFKGTKSITPKKALEEIISGNISKTNPSSGAIYLYVLENILYWGNCIRYRKADVPKEIEHLVDNRHSLTSSLSIGGKLKDESNAFNTINSIKAVEQLFILFETNPLPFPMPDDFPLFSLIRYEQLIELKKDFSHLNLYEEANIVFEKWLDETILKQQDLVLYYY